MANPYTHSIILGNKIGIDEKPNDDIKIFTSKREKEINRKFHYQILEH